MSSNISKNAKWYVVHTYSGSENKVKTNLEKIVDNRNLHDYIIDVKVPTEDVVETKGDEKRTVTRKIFPGYVLIKMVMTDDTWYIIRNTPGVTDAEVNDTATPLVNPVPFMTWLLSP